MKLDYDEKNILKELINFDLEKIDNYFDNINIEENENFDEYINDQVNELKNLLSKLKCSSVPGASIKQIESLNNTALKKQNS